MSTMAKLPIKTEVNRRKAWPRPFIVCCEDWEGIHPVPGYRYATRKAAEYALGGLDAAFQVQKQIGRGGYQLGWYEFCVQDIRESHAEK
jgi:hypothetical protein